MGGQVSDQAVQAGGSDNFGSPAAPEDYVRWGYRLLLGREPESVEVIQNNPFKNNRHKLVEFLLESVEFKVKYKDFGSKKDRNPYASWEREAVAFIHLPKTGGTTLYALLSNCFHPDRICHVGSHTLYNFSPAEITQYDFFSGHTDYFSLNFIPRRRLRRISMFRDPMQRLISWYRFKKSHPIGGDFDGDLGNRLAKDHSPEEFFEHPYNIATLNNSYLVYFGASIDDPSFLDALAAETSAASTRDDGAPSEFITKALQLATERIVGLDALGLTDSFQELVASVFGALGFSVPKSITSAMVTDDLPKSDPVFRPVEPVMMTERLTRGLQRLTKYDQILYDVAKKEFARRRMAGPRSF